MILLEVSKSLEIRGISITDWIQALGAFIAIVAAIIGFIQLLKKDKDKQKQINNLTVLAQQSENQTKQLSAQVDQMIEGNRLQTEYLSLFQKSISISETYTELNQEQKKLDEKRRKFQIKPRLEFDNMSKQPAIIHLVAINKGETAKLLELKKLAGNTMTPSNLKQIINKIIQKNENLEISFTPMVGLATFQCYVKVKVIYSDVDNNKYSQIIEGHGDNILKIENQIELK